MCVCVSLSSYLSPYSSLFQVKYMINKYQDLMVLFDMWERNRQS